jgi:hypothetical protein
MSRLRRIGKLRLSSEALDIRIAQVVCFSAAPALLFLAAYALRRHAATPGEVVVGLLAAVAVCLLCVILGLVLPLARNRTPA